MKPSQIAWLLALVSAVCTALIGQAELLGEPWRHYVTTVSVIATAISGFMLQRPNPWNGEERRAFPRDIQAIVELERRQATLPPGLPPPCDPPPVAKI